MSEALTPEDLNALAETFGSGVSAVQLLEEIGLDRSQQPLEGVLSAVEFWREINRMLAAGIVLDGRRRLMAAASRRYPANTVFRRSTAANPTPATWRTPWHRNPNFTGRTTELAELRSRLQGSGSIAVLPQALHGLGGIGKSQLAVEYAYRHRLAYDVVWWIDAEQPGAVLASLAELAGRLGVATFGEAAESARRAVQ